MKKKEKRMNARILIGGLLIVGILTVIFAVPAIAADSGSTVVTGTVGAYIDVTAPTAIDLSDMQIGNNTGHSDDNGIVSTNENDWYVNAADQSNLGYMMAGETRLQNKLQIGDNGETWASADPDPGLTYNNPTYFPFYVSQEVTPADPPGDYSITITFIGTVVD
jgi:hypothetical protein